MSEQRSEQTTSGTRWATWLIPAFAAACLVPGAGSWEGVPPWGALTAGVAVALLLGNPYAARTRPLTSRLLALSVVGLGAAMDLGRVAVVGLHGVGYTFIGVAGTLAAGALLGGALAVRRRAALLVAVGTAICGGSAIAAAAPVIGADDDETSAALAIVFLLNSAALLLFPPLGHLLGLSQEAFGLWAALAVHDTSSVVGASATYGPVALAVATTTKLARALWIVPVTLALGALAARERGAGAVPGRARRPWFILGFLAAAALVTWVPALRPAGAAVAAGARRLLVLTLFVLGLGLSRASLSRVGARPLVLGVLLWVLAGSASLAAIRAGLVH